MSEENGLPNGWAEATLLDCCSRITDGTHLPPKFVDEGIPFIFVKHIAQGRLTFDDTRFITTSTWQAFQTRCPVEEGDILYSAVGSYGVAVLVDTARPFSFQRHIAHIKPDRRLHTKYLTYLLNSPLGLRQAHAVARGVAQKTVTLGDLKQFSVLIAPLPEQHRIVEMIEELFSDLDAGVASLERAKANLKRYRASVLKSAVEGRLTEEWRKEHPQAEDGQMLLDRILRERREKWEKDQLLKFKEKSKEPPKNWQSKYEEPSAPDTSELPELPEGWVWATVEQLLVYIRNGYFQSPTKATTGIPLLRINAVRPMSVDLDEVRYLDEVEGDVDDFYVHNGDLLFTRYNGSVDLLGVAGMVRGCTRDTLHPDKLIRVVLGLGSPLPEFVEISANVGASRKHISGRARTTAGQTGISGSDIREMPIPLPPLAEQERIVALVEERLFQIDSAEKTIDSELIRSKRLRQSILKRAFEGKLVPQDLKDEPASVLLERIKATREAEQPKKKAKKATKVKAK